MEQFNGDVDRLAIMTGEALIRIHDIIEAILTDPTKVHQRQVAEIKYLADKLGATGMNLNVD
ncbi:hypothetical protein [Nocardia tengchongensis]